MTTSAVRTFTAPGGTRLAYREHGAGTPVVCLPGGPMQDPRYLGDLGGLSRRVRLVLLDLRGTGSSQTPIDPTSYRGQRMVDDVEALRTDLHAEQVAVLGHPTGDRTGLRHALRVPADAVSGRIRVDPGDAKPTLTPVRGGFVE